MNDNFSDVAHSANQNTSGNKNLDENDITSKVTTSERASKEEAQKLLPTTGNKETSFYFIIRGLLLSSALLALVLKLKLREKKDEKICPYCIF